jgi:hypothetical protein
VFSIDEIKIVEIIGLNIVAQSSHAFSNGGPGAQTPNDFAHNARFGQNTQDF